MKRNLAWAMICTGLLAAFPNTLFPAQPGPSRLPEFWGSFPTANSHNRSLLLRFRDEVAAAAGLEGGFEALGLPPELESCPVCVLGVGVDGKTEFAMAFAGTDLPLDFQNRPNWTSQSSVALWKSHPDFPARSIDFLLKRVRNESKEVSGSESGSYRIVMRADWMHLPQRQSDSVVELPGGSLGSALASIESVRVEGTIAEEVSMNFEVDFPSPDLAAVAGDAWRRLFIGYGQGSGGARSLLDSLAKGEVIGVDRHLSVRIPFSRAALERLHHSRASRQFLLWNQLGYQREARERAPELFQNLGVAPGARLADLGAGGGFYTLRLARGVGEQGRVYAVDISSTALSTLRRLSQESTLGNIEVVAGEADNPGLEGKDLDGVLIVNAYHEMEEYPEILDSLMASLHPGGRLVLLEPYSPETADQSRAQQTERHQISPELVVKDLEAAGFEVIFVDRKFVQMQGDGNTHLEGLVVARRP